MLHVNKMNSTCPCQVWLSVHLDMNERILFFYGWKVSIVLLLLVFLAGAFGTFYIRIVSLTEVR